MARDIGDQIMLAEWLFVNTVADLRARAESPRDADRYVLLGIAPLLRKLFIEQGPLYDVVRRKHPNVPVRFAINAHDQRFHPDEATGRGWKTVISFGREELVGHPPAGVGATTFLDTTVGHVESEPVSVRAIVRYYANVEGGVHFGKPSNKMDAFLALVTPSTFGGGFGNGPIEVLGHLAAIVADALRPLAETIASAPTHNPALELRTNAGPIESNWFRNQKRGPLAPEGGERA